MSGLRLPKTGATIPAELGALVLKVTSSYQTRNGVGFLIEVSNPAGQRMGVLENQGNGGGTWFLHDDVAWMRWWDEAVAAYALIPEALADQNKMYAEVGLPPMETLGNPAEALAEALTEEAFA